MSQIIERKILGIKQRLAMLKSENLTINELEFHEQYIMDNHKTQTRAELAEHLHLGTQTVTFRIVALEREGKLKTDDVPKILRYEPKPKIYTTKRTELDLPVDRMAKEIKITANPNEGAKLHKVKVDLGKIYEVSVNNLRENSTRYINYFKGKAIFDGPHFIVLRSKQGYNESFLKSSIAIREVTIKQVTY